MTQLLEHLSSARDRHKLLVPYLMAGMPDFFIVGAPKCGTTALYAYLRRDTPPGPRRSRRRGSEWRRGACGPARCSARRSA